MEPKRREYARDNMALKRHSNMFTWILFLYTKCIYIFTALKKIILISREPRHFTAVHNSYVNFFQAYDAIFIREINGFGEKMATKIPEIAPRKFIKFSLLTSFMGFLYVVNFHHIVNREYKFLWGPEIKCQQKRWGDTLKLYGWCR